LLNYIRNHWQKEILIAVIVCLLFSGACSGLKEKTSNKDKSSGSKTGDASSKPVEAVVDSNDLFSVGEREVDLFWQTVEPVATSISYGQEADSLKIVKRKGKTTNHYLRIKNLKPETTYYYKINGAEDGGLKEFTTLAAPGGKYLFSFAVCTDIHLSNTKLDQFGAFYKESYDIFNRLVDEVKKDKVDFFVVKGDISHGTVPGDYQTFSQATSKLDCNTYVVPGNHDKEQATWGLFFNGFSPSSSSYFSIDHKKWHFVFMDSPTIEKDNGYFGPEQLSWLEQDLKANSKRPTMIFMHHLVHKSVIREGERFFVGNSDEFLKLIDPYPVVAVHSGHAHINNVSRSGDTDFIVTGAVINYPMQYNVYHVYEKGYVQVSHRISSYIDQGEVSKEAIRSVYSVRLGTEPALVSKLVEGNLSDRSFVRSIK